MSRSATLPPKALVAFLTASRWPELPRGRVRAPQFVLQVRHLRVRLASESPLVLRISLADTKSAFPTMPPSWKKRKYPARGHHMEV